ncbi:nuclear transport factor 2 family protein [Streptomyces sp. NBC_01565]|uniref:nuclear transport factor 2 family protein n=1 Tax=unclassified Streptomyces TaxID=2593676 RepID=UPI00224EDD8F|nr:nuclear transport factor 2 family protein [Streptomyces sp. NBC_01565]MCX4547025.1 nuclear transport factor 2 family protein [Streptomyces sp. NBC_01565]
MNTDAETVVRAAYRAAEGSVLDVEGFMNLFAEDGVFNNVVAVELTIQGTFTGPFETPAGTVRPTGAALNIPTADFWYVENGRIKEFNCYVGLSVMLAQLGVHPDFASAVAASAAAPS